MGIILEEKQGNQKLFYNVIKNIRNKLEIKKVEILSKEKEIMD